ncbi:flagellar hook-length control protein FliK [Microvirga sp. BT689]|uniref:flagellar hook-length control protein FliK n=1 Tax=Microvirga arvi TaxID=2778731 RepID=UPI00194E3D68|nr:flagellar hook-length control protein FliK [Microvirga arvi]MBM6580023.1 flagellar hook-length control protein FliK [Microvirga arvi]
MSRLDLMPQTPSRSVETSQTPRGFSSAAGAQQGGNGSGSEMKGFDSMLDGFSKEQSRENADPLADIDLLDLSTDGAKDAPVVDLTSLQALLPTTPADSASAGAAAFQPGSQVYSVLENLLPRILPQAGASGQPAPELRDGALASPMLATPSLDKADEGILSSAYGSRLAVSVQNQETHFRPIIEGFESALQEPAPDGSIDPQGAAFEGEGAGKKSKEISAKLPSGNLQGALGDKPLILDADPVGTRPNGEKSFERFSLDRVADRPEVQKQASPVSKADGGLLPSETLHQMARAILDDVGGISEPQEASFQGDGVNRVAVARASGGVLRVLSLQLNPVELGLVTIKMRLAGDSLEMELQVEKEETAELLRNDADKLSSLLRTSGYRPDVITIQSTDTTTHDRNALQRPQQGTQDQSFQGAAAGQGHSSGHRKDPYGAEGAEARNEPKEDRISDRGGSGGIYL